jgi:aminoglycoside N3'-acetyltransferase
LGELGGSVVLVGVGLTSMTLLHLAESLAGRRRFVRWANDAHGRPAAWDTGSCSEGFDRFEPALAGLARETFVGSSRWRAYPAKETAETAAAAIRADPEITRCADPTCLRCPDAIAGGPVDDIC